MLAHRWGGAAFHNAGWNARHMDGVDHAFLYCLEIRDRPSLHPRPGRGARHLPGVGAAGQPARGHARPRSIATGVDIRPEAMGIDWEDAGDGDAAACLVRPPRRYLVYRRRCPAGDRRAARSGEGSPVRGSSERAEAVAPIGRVPAALERRSTMIGTIDPQSRLRHDGALVGVVILIVSACTQLGRLGRPERRRAHRPRPRARPRPARRRPAAAQRRRVVGDRRTSRSSTRT